MSTEQVSEMQFGHSRQATHVTVGAEGDGNVQFRIHHTEDSGLLEQTTTHMSHTLSLGQAIQLRDFLDRHIDRLALKQTGSLAVRSSDDPTQLAAVEEVPAERGCGTVLWFEDGRGVQCGETVNGVLHCCLSCPPGDE